jgi:hypothetical protein
MANKKTSGNESENPVVEGVAGAKAPVEMLKTKDLLDRVTADSAVKRKDAKPVLDALLKVIGEALAEGKALNLPPLGKVSVSRTKENAKGDVVMLKLKRAKLGEAVPEAAE